MPLYTLSNILLIEKSIVDSSVNVLDEDVINLLYTIEYKFKDRKQYKSKYNNPKPIAFSDIRLNLNKLSNLNYSIYFKQIISILHVLNKNDTSTIFNDIFLHISNDAFLVAPYSKLSAALLEIFPEYRTIFFYNNSNLINKINDIDFNYSNTLSNDYIFTLNKNKDTIKANVHFLSNTLINISDFSTLINNIISIQELLNTYINEPIFDNKYKEKCELLSDIILIYNKISMKYIYSLSAYAPIKYNVECILSKKSEKHISRRIIFNHMDIIDIFNNINNN